MSHQDNCYQKIIKAYLYYREQHPDTHIDHCLSQRSLATAIEIAAQSVNHEQKIHAHQRRIGRQRLQEWAIHLSKYGNTIQSAPCFEKILAVVEKAAHEFPGGGIGELTVYDTAHRIGAKRKLLPDKIYMHSGTRKGAAVFCNNLTHDTPTIAIIQLPDVFHHLDATQLEDILCMYKKELKACKESSDSPLPTRSKPKC